MSWQKVEVRTSKQNAQKGGFFGVKLKGDQPFFGGKQPFPSLARSIFGVGVFCFFCAGLHPQTQQKRVPLNNCSPPGAKLLRSFLTCPQNRQPLARLEYGYPFSVVYFGNPPQRKATGHYWGT